jgi:hypothetical protein
METELAKRTDPSNGAGALVEKVVVGGDLSKLTPAERLSYYSRICQSLSLNPLTRPFQYIWLNGKLTLYAGAGCTDQLRDRNGVSITKIERGGDDDTYEVIAYAKDRNGREDAAIGAVAIKGLTGEARANAKMKAETKAKRRVTLSIVGLGMMDESEVGPGFRLPDESQVTGISEAVRADVDPETGEIKAGAEPEPEAGSGAGDPEQERSLLLGYVKGAADKLGLKAAKRAELWAKFCGHATPENVDPSALAELLKAIRELGKAAQGK